MDIRGDNDGFLVGSKVSDNELSEEMQEIRDSLDNIESTVSSIESLLKKAGALLPSNARQKQEKTTVISPRSNEEKRTNSTRVKAENKLRQTNTDKLATPSRRSDSSRVIGRGATEKTERRDATSNQLRSGSPHDTVVPKSKSSGIGGEEKDAAKNAVANREKDGVAASKPQAQNYLGSDASTPSRSSRAGAKTGGNEVVEPKKRDAKGRFIGKGGEGGNDAYGSDTSRENRSASLLAEKLAEAVKDGTESVGDADPTVQAMNEIAQPVSRGFEMVKDAWGDSEESGWLRKILKSVGAIRKDQTAFNKAEKKVLASIDENTEKAANKNAEGGGLSIMGGLGGKLAALTPMLGAFAKRLPIIGAAFAGFKGVFDFFDSEWDKNLTREEKDKKSGKAIGGASGTIAGGFAGAKAGAMLGTAFGPLGTAIGGIVGGLGGMILGDKIGDIFGEKIGSWVSDLRKMNLGETITKNFTEFTAGLSSTWNNAIGGLSEFWDKAKDGVSKHLENLNDWVKDKTGIDVGAAMETASTAASNAVKSVKNWFGFGGDKSNTTSTSKPTSYKDQPVDPNKWTLGSTSERFESGGKGAGTISSGRGDFGGVSYGTYQLASNNGSVQKFINAKGYGEQFKGMRAGSREFNAKWQELAKNDPSFAQAQHDYIKETHYDKAQAGLAEQGIDLSKRGKAVQDMLWSTSVQFGAGSAKANTGAVGMVNKALAGRDIEKMSDEEIITAVQDYKLANNDKLFKSSSANVRAGTAKRASLEKERLLKLAQAEKEKGPASEQATLSNVGLGEKKAHEKGILSGVRKEETPLPQGGGVGPTVANAERLKAIKDREAKEAQSAVSAKAAKVSESVKDVSDAHAVLGSEIGNSMNRREAEARARGAKVSVEEGRLVINGGASQYADYESPIDRYRKAIAKSNASAEKTFKAPQVQTPAPAPVSAPTPVDPVKTPMATNDKPSTPVVKVEKEAGQDVRDRSIAHIATGGFSGGD